MPSVSRSYAEYDWWTHEKYNAFNGIDQLNSLFPFLPRISKSALKRSLASSPGIPLYALEIGIDQWKSGIYSYHRHWLKTQMRNARLFFVTLFFVPSLPLFVSGFGIRIIDKK